VPNKGAMSELESMFGSHWVRTYEGDLSASDLELAISYFEAYCPEELDMGRLSWDNIAIATREAYLSVVGADLVSNKNHIK